MTEFFLAFWLFFLSMLLSPNAKCANTSEKSSTDFWISLELLSADFRKGCISTALCHQPAFKLAQVMTLDGQTAMMSWPLLGGADSLLQKENPRLFVAHWTLGDVEDVAISCQIAGTDPSFGFARVCDETPARRLFQEQMVRQTVMKGARMAEETPLFNQRNGGERGGEGDELLVQMRGRCFNATLAVRKHVSRCPWCPDPNLDIQVVGGTAGPGQQSEQSQRGEALELHNALILALSGAVVFSLTGLCCVLCAHWRYRRRNNNGNRASKQRGAALIIGSSGSGKHTKKRILKQLVSQPRAQRSLPISPLGGGAHRQQKEQREFTALYGQHQQQQRPQQQGGPEEQRYHHSLA